MSKPVVGIVNDDGRGEEHYRGFIIDVAYPSGYRVWSGDGNKIRAMRDTRAAAKNWIDEYWR